MIEEFKKKVLHTKIVWVLFPILLAGCTSGESLTQEEIAGEVTAHQTEVQSYHADIRLNTLVTDLETGEPINESKTSTAITINEETLDSFGVISSEANQQKINQEYYSIGDQAYLKMGNSRREDVSSRQAEYFHNTDTFYSELVPILDVLTVEGELEEKNNQYILTFKGQSLELYNSFEKPFNLRFGNIQPEDINQDIQIIVDKETLFIQSVENSLTAQDSGQDLEIYIEQLYKNINDTEDFTIPQDVIDEAMDK